MNIKINMLSYKLITGLIYPYIIVFLIAGLFFLFYYKFLVLRFPLLSLKILSGALDWKGSKGKITPGKAFFSGILGSFFPGQLLGLIVALAFSGPGIILLIWIVHFLQASIEFVLSTVSFKFRIRNPNGNLETGLLLGVERFSRIRWFGFVYTIFFVVLSILYGFWDLSFLHILSNSKSLKHPLLLDSNSLMILFIIFMILIFNGGIRRIGLFAKIVAYTMILLIILIGISYKKSLELFPLILNEFLVLFSNTQNIKITLFSIVIYSILSEIPSPKLNLFSGYVRTDHAAKQGIATIIYPLIQSIIVFLLMGTIYEFIQNAKIEIQDLNEIHVVLSQIHMQLLESLILSPSREVSINFLIYFLIILILFSSFLTWFFSGNMILRQIAYRFKFPNFYPTLSIFIYIYLIFFINWELYELYKNFYIIFIFVSGIVSILTIIFALIYYNLGKYELTKYQESYQGGIDLSRDLYVMIFSIIPSNLLSKLFGLISLIQFPQPIMYWIILGFTKLYKIDLNEVKNDIKSFKNLNEFFIRELKDGIRKIDKGKKIIVSPVDALLSRRGTIQEGLMIQTKGIYYTLKDLLGDPDYIPYFENGKYCVLYLSPQDYHRIHAPFDCEVEGYTYSPGHLFPVNEPAVEGLYGLFPKNERLTTFLKTRYGRIAMVKVGATNVGKIRVMYDSIKTNTWIRRKKAIQYKHKIIFKKGQEIARFEMGSTVILIFEKNKVEFLEEAPEGIKVKLGQAIAKFE